MINFVRKLNELNLLLDQPRSILLYKYRTQFIIYQKLEEGKRRVIENLSGLNSFDQSDI